MQTDGARLLLAVAVTALAFILKTIFSAYLGPPYILFYPAIMLSAVAGGLGPGLLATALSSGFAVAFVLPAARPGPWSPSELVGLVTFTGMGVFMSLVGERYRRTRGENERLELERSLREREESVSARNAAEERLRTSEARLRLLVEHTPAAVALFDREMRYLAVSRRYAQDYRLSEPDLVGRCHYDVFPEIPARWKEIHRRSLAGAVEACAEDPFPRGDGTTDWVRWELHPWRGEDGAVGGVVLFSEVITERKHAEQKLAAERERLAVTLQSIGDAVIATDTAARVTVFNDVAARLTGWPAAEALGRPLAEVFRIVAEADGRALETPVERVLREGRVTGLANHTALVARDGTARPIADSGAPIRDAAGRMVGVVLVFRDQTEERRAENERRAGDQRLRLAVEAAKAGTWEWDLRTDRNTWSDGLWDLYGLARDGREATYQIWRDSLHPDDRQRVEQVVGEAARTGSELSVEWRVALPGGAVRWLASRGRPIRDADGAFTRFMGIVLDVTEAKQGEQALRESERRYRLLADHTHDVIWTMDLATGRYSYVSPSILALRGLTVEEALAEPVERGMTPESLARVQATLAAIGTPAERDPATDVYDQPCKDGTIKHVEITTTLVRDPAGRAVQVVGVSRDATARVEAQRALVESEGLYRSLFQLAPSGVVLLDEVGAIVAFNDQACQQLGYPRQEFARLRVGDVNVAGSAAVAGHLRRIAAAGAEELEVVHRTRSGELRTVQVNSRHVLVEGRSRFLATWQDVTERRRAEEALRRSEERFRALIERSTDVIVVLDAEGTLRFWSQGAVAVLGWTPEERVGRPGGELVHPEDRPRVAEVLAQLLARRGHTASELARFRHKDGSWRHLQLTARDLLADPAVEGVVVNARDVTTERMLEEQFRQAQKLESVGRLAGGVAHDFNNLLTVILSCTQELEQALVRGRPASLDDVREIDGAAQRAAELTGQLLAFARKQLVAPVPLDLGQVLAGSERMLRRLLGEDIELQVEREPGLWTTRADPGQVTQVIVNLAVNARDAMPTGGALLLRATNVSVSAAEAAADPERLAGDWVGLTIRDTGAGISPEVRAHIFEPFFTTKERGKGTGLGLATVYGIIQQAGGHVHVSSVPGRGTTFEACFPRVEVAPAEPARLAKPETLGGTERILVVEDDPRVRAVTVRTLRAAGYDVLAVPEPRAALELPAGDLARLQLLVTDVVMPGLDGRELAAQLCGRHPALRVLFVSGYAPDTIAARGALDPGSELLPKPFTGAALLGRLRAILDRA
jgi:PAS domain S-box-containing protein